MKRLRMRWSDMVMMEEMVTATAIITITIDKEMKTKKKEETTTTAPAIPRSFFSTRMVMATTHRSFTISSHIEGWRMDTVFGFLLAHCAI